MSFLSAYSEGFQPANKSKSLRNHLNSNHLIRAIGVHNGLSARIGEQSGFEALWASSFEISTSFGIPDASLISMDKYVNVIRDICSATKLPIIADCDSGFGGLANTAKMAFDMEQAGVSAICIEDNLYPKKCSFYKGKRELASIEEHCHRIQVIKKTLQDPNTVVIARTEALIANWGMEEALKRAEAYHQAGADLILVHSKSSTPDEVFAFADQWGNKLPLVCVPTTYNDVSDEELFKRGYHIVIYANHAIRASIQVMKKVLRRIQEAKKASVLESDIASLAQVFELVEEPIYRDINSLSN